MVKATILNVGEKGLLPGVVRGDRCQDDCGVLVAVGYFFPEVNPVLELPEHHFLLFL